VRQHGARCPRRPGRARCRPRTPRPRCPRWTCRACGSRCPGRLRAFPIITVVGSVIVEVRDTVAKTGGLECALMRHPAMEVASICTPPSPPHTGLDRRHHAHPTDQLPFAATSRLCPASDPHLTVVLPGLHGSAGTAGTSSSCESLVGLGSGTESRPAVGAASTVPRSITRGVLPRWRRRTRRMRAQVNSANVEQSEEPAGQRPLTQVQLCTSATPLRRNRL
jgi:hypothetical protein